MKEAKNVILGIVPPCRQYRSFSGAGGFFKIARYAALLPIARLSLGLSLRPAPTLNGRAGQLGMTRAPRGVKAAISHRNVTLVAFPEIRSIF